MHGAPLGINVNFMIPLIIWWQK